MLVGDLMTPHPKTVESSDPVALALETMEDFHIRHLPVLEDGKLVGILSDRDLLTHSPPTDFAMHNLRETMGLMDREVGGVMSPNPVSLEVGETITAAIDRMLELRIGSVCVVEEGRLVGILTQLDVLRVLRPFAPRLDVMPAPSHVGARPQAAPPTDPAQPGGDVQPEL